MLRKSLCLLAAISAFAAPAAATTTLLDDLNPGSASSFSFPGLPSLPLATAGGWSYFVTGTQQLWRTDGTMANTTLLADSSSPTCCWSNLSAVNGRLIYFNSAGLLGTSDGTPAGTSLISPVGFSNGFFISNWDNLPGEMLVVTRSSSEYDVWVSDGLQADTRKLLTTALSPVATVNFAFLPGPKLVIGGPGGLWTTSSPTSATTSIASGFDVASSILVSGTSIYFAGHDAAHGTELWKSDLTSAGTQLVADLTAGSAGSNISLDAVNGNTLYFHIGDNLWTSDGTPAGTVQLTSGVIAQKNLHILSNGLALFVGQEDDGYRLWRSDATAAGTVSYTSLLPSGVNWLVDLGDTLMFAVYDNGIDPNVFTTAGADGDLAEVGVSRSGAAPSDRNKRFGRTSWMFGQSGAYASFVRSDTREIGEIGYFGPSNFTTVEPGLAGGSYFYSANKTTTLGYEPYVTDLTATSAPICSNANATLPSSRSDTIFIPQHATAHNMTVDLRVMYPFVGNLAATLTHVETGRTVDLFDRAVGCSGQDLDIIFDDAASQPLTAGTCSATQPAYPAGQSLKPAQPLAGFVDEDIHGTWTITVTNSNARDHGGIAQWCLDTSGKSDVIFRNGFE